MMIEEYRNLGNRPNSILNIPASCCTWPETRDVVSEVKRRISTHIPARVATFGREPKDDVGVLMNMNFVRPPRDYLLILPILFIYNRFQLNGLTKFLVSGHVRTSPYIFYPGV